MPRIPLNMPKMSMTMEFGTIVEWLIEVGQPVSDGDAVVVVTTDKVDMDVESTINGVLVEVLAGEGEDVPVGQPIGYIESETDDLLGDLFAAPPPADPATSPEPTSAPATRDDQESIDSTSVAPDVQGRVRAVPLARRLAAEAGLDLASVAASGPGGTVRARDVRAALADDGPGGRRVAEDASVAPIAQPVAPAAVASGDLLGDAKSRRMRIATAKALEATAQIPQFTAFRTLDLGRLAVARRASLAGISWTTLLVRAYALMLREYPALNGSWVGHGVQPNDHVGVALAVDTPVGLLAPVLRDPDRQALRVLNDEIKTLAAEVKQGNIDPDRLRGGTGTVSNLGSMGIESFNALLTPPQATALSLGAVGSRPAFDPGGELRAVMGCVVGLTIDHRVADGADAARALTTMQALLDEPLLLLS